MKFKVFFFVTFITTAILIILMMLQGAPLKIDFTPAGIIDLELSGTVDNAAAIYNAWSPALINIAIKHTSIDFLFIVSYGCLLFVACYKITKQGSVNVKKIGRAMCFAVVTATFFDVFENVLLLRILTGHISREVVASTFFFASVKFGLIGLTILFIAFSFVASLFAVKQEEVSIG